MFLGKTRLFQPGVQIDRAIKFSADIGLATAFSHYLGIGSGAEHKLQRVIKAYQSLKKAKMA